MPDITSSAAMSLAMSHHSSAAPPPLQEARVPTNCSAPGDSWGRTAFNCSIPPSYSATCMLGAPPAAPDTALCEVLAGGFRGWQGDFEGEQHVQHVHACCTLQIECSVPNDALPLESLHGPPPPPPVFPRLFPHTACTCTAACAVVPCLCAGGQR